MHTIDSPLVALIRRLFALGSGTGAAPGLFRIMLLMGLYLAVVQINRSGGAVMASELMSTRGYRPTEVGAIMGSMFLAAAVVQLPAGVLYDRHGPRVMLSTLNVIAVVGLILFAFAASVPGLTLGRALIGLGHGTVIAGIYLLAVAWVPADRVATVTGTVIGMAGGIGAVLATTPLALILGKFGFTLTFAVLAALTMAFSAAIFFSSVTRRTPATGAMGVPPRVSGRVCAGCGKWPATVICCPSTSWAVALPPPFSPSAGSGQAPICVTSTT
jgi:MFS family permease